MAEVVLKDLVKRFGKQEILHGIDLQVHDSEFLVLVGPSGCGKTTTLRMIAGLESISGGEVFIGGKRVNDVPPKDRNIAMVFQNYALYPHMNVFQNMAFGLTLKKTPKREIEQRVTHAARILKIEDLLKRKPSQLSGGQRQRVAMGRAIVRNPAIFLFDEPLSNLDAKLRTQMRVEIKQIHQQSNTTAIYVTHDQVEAMTLGDRIVVMRDGYIEQIGGPIELFERPNNIFVAGFIGNPPMNLLEGTMKRTGDAWQIALSSGLTIPVPPDNPPVFHENQSVVFGLRPEDIHPADEGVPDRQAQEVRLVARVDVVEPHGSQTYLHISIQGTAFTAICSGRRIVKPMETVPMALNMRHAHFFDARGKRASVA